MNNQFVYIDSSQEQDNYSRQLRPKNYGTQPQQLSPTYKQNTDTNADDNPHTHAHPRTYRKCLSTVIQNTGLKKSQYEILVQNLLSQKISKQVCKKFLSNVQDTEIARNIDKRNLNYQYFLQKIEIDQKYRAMLQEKADKLKLQNQKKKLVLYRHQNQQQLKKQQAQLQKYCVEKHQKQQRAVTNVKKHIKKLGFERIYTAHKKIKQQIKEKQKNQKNNLQSRMNKQRNELLQLQEMYEQAKEEKRINKLEQRKVIKQLAEKVGKEKEGLREKYGKKQKQDFVL